eukprot:symbB.v1.2.019175.t1/scaffold1559.1/size111769/8
MVHDPTVRLREQELVRRFASVICSDSAPWPMRDFKQQSESRRSLVAMRGPLECFICGGDHYARDCFEGGQGKGKSRKGKHFVECYNCGGAHLARDCPGGKGGKAVGKRLECFNCGGNHYARDCPDGKGKGKSMKGSYGGKSVCCDFRDNGLCRFGDECRFAHGA